jgi:hypothetical protein
LVPEKYGSTTRPVALRTYSSMPSRLSCSQISGTAALPDDGVVDRLTGFALPDMVVSRWLVIPIAAISSELISAFASTSTSVELCVAQIPLGHVLPSLEDKFAQIRAVTR